MTKNELKCNEINKTLFEITDDMPEEMKLSRMGVFKYTDESIKDIDNQNKEETDNKKYNFRPYDQGQSFFYRSTQKSF